MRSSRLRLRLRDPSNMFKNAIHNYKKNLLLLRWWSLQGSENDIRWHFSRFLDCPCIFIEINNGISGNLLKKGPCLTHGPFFLRSGPYAAILCRKNRAGVVLLLIQKERQKRFPNRFCLKGGDDEKKITAVILLKQIAYHFAENLFLLVVSNTYKNVRFF